MPVTADTVGVDVGFKDLFVTDTGFKTINPRHAAKYGKRLALLQLRLSKKKAQKTAPKPAIRLPASTRKLLIAVWISCIS